MFVAHYLLGLPIIEAGMLGFIIAAVSPAVIVPQMLSFIKRRMGTKKGIPLIILTGASVDDVVSITIFSIFLGIYGGQQVNYLITVALSIPHTICTRNLIWINYRHTFLYTYLNTLIYVIPKKP